jgi:hypothetical protein
LNGGLDIGSRGIADPTGDFPSSWIFDFQDFSALRIGPLAIDP